jgi:hypothetical protein
VTTCHHRGHDREWTTASEPLETEEDVDILTDGGDEA